MKTMQSEVGADRKQRHHELWDAVENLVGARRELEALHNQIIEAPANPPIERVDKTGGLPSLSVVLAESAMKINDEASNIRKSIQDIQSSIF